MMNHTKSIIGSGVTLGIGAFALNSMGQKSISNAIMPSASKMVGVAGTVGFGMHTLNMVNSNFNSMSKKKFKKWF